MRERDDGNAEDEGHSAQDHERLSAHPVGEHAGEERGNHAAEKHCCNDDRKLAGI